MLCALVAAAATVSSKSRRLTRSGCTGGIRRGRRPGPASLTTVVDNGPAAARMAAAGRTSRCLEPSAAAPDLHALDVRMARKYHPTPLSGGDRKALKKELRSARGMTGILAAQSDEMRSKGDALIRQADRLLCESWNERMWADGEPVDPSPTIDQATNGGFPWLQVECSRCRTPNDVDLAALRRPPTTFVHDLASRLRCRKCAQTGRRPAATLLQLAQRRRNAAPEI